MGQRAIEDIRRLWCRSSPSSRDNLCNFRTSDLPETKRCLCGTMDASGNCLDDRRGSAGCMLFGSLCETRLVHAEQHAFPKH